MGKPTINTRPVANNYAAPNERIIEVSNGVHGMEARKGGLISLRVMDDGTLVIDVYQLDAGVKVNVSQPPQAEKPAATGPYWVEPKGLGDGRYGPFATQTEAEEFFLTSDLITTETHAVKAAGDLA